MNRAKAIVRSLIRREASLEGGLPAHRAGQEFDRAGGHHEGDRAAEATSVTSRGDLPRA
jgi:hypothetical protein